MTDKQIACIFFNRKLWGLLPDHDELKEGKNVLVIETGPAFFLSITDDDQW